MSAPTAATPPNTLLEHTDVDGDRLRVHTQPLMDTAGELVPLGVAPLTLTVFNEWNDDGHSVYLDGTALDDLIDVLVTYRRQRDNLLSYDRGNVCGRTTCDH